MPAEDIQTANSAIWIKVLGPGTADADYVFAGLVRTANAKRTVDKKEFVGMPYGKVGEKNTTKGHSLECEMLYKNPRNVALLNCHNPNDYVADGHVVDTDAAVKVNCAVKLLEINDSETGAWGGDFASVPGIAKHYPNCTLDPNNTMEYEHGKEFAGKLVFSADYDDDLKGFRDMKAVTAVDVSDETTTGFGVEADGTIS